jgi:ketosteroid isomerase-like protein
MRLTLLIVVSFFAQTIFAQKDTAAVLAAVQKLEKAFTTKDSATVNALLHKDVVFAHSNGWVQTKKKVVDDMMSGYLDYKTIEETGIAIEISKEKAVVTERLSVSGARDGNPFELKLFVLQVWLQGKKGWQLFARQGSKL